MFEVTIFSPQDNEEHVNYCKDPDALIASVAMLSIAMEPGAWFKVRRMYETELVRTADGTTIVRT